MVFLKLVHTEYQVNHKTGVSGNLSELELLTPHHILVISNLILAKNKKSNVRRKTWFLVLCRNGG
jgi:hypothetical protein